MPSAAVVFAEIQPCDSASWLMREMKAVFPEPRAPETMVHKLGSPRPLSKAAFSSSTRDSRPAIKGGMTPNVGCLPWTLSFLSVLLLFGGVRMGAMRRSLWMALQLLQTFSSFANFF